MIDLVSGEPDRSRVPLIQAHSNRRRHCCRSAELRLCWRTQIVVNSFENYYAKVKAMHTNEQHFLFFSRILHALQSVNGKPKKMCKKVFAKQSPKLSAN